MSSKRDIANRIQDEVKGIRAGAAPSMVPEGTVAAEEEYVPRLEEMELPLIVRRKFISLAASHAEWGRLEKEATTGKKEATDGLKALINENEIEAKAFYAGENRIAHYTTSRESVDKAVLKHELHSLIGKKLTPIMVQDVLLACIRSSTSYTVRVTPPGEED